jgi:hypothetical protein
MRIPILPSIAAILSASVCLAADFAASPAPPPVVHLDGVKSLEALRQSNLAHFARAERIIAAANELCRPGPLENDFTRFEAKDISCNGALLKTSNPPKKELQFTLDRTRYLALVAITDDAPRVRPATR